MGNSNELKNFSSLVDRVLSVSKVEILRREEEQKKYSALNFIKRGPKPKIKTSSFPDPDVS
jgi:hypothetical protein